MFNRSIDWLTRMRSRSLMLTDALTLEDGDCAVVARYGRRPCRFCVWFGQNFRIVMQFLCRLGASLAIGEMLCYRRRQDFDAFRNP
jgi:hypothetical protein